MGQGTDAHRPSHHKLLERHQTDQTYSAECVNTPYSPLSGDLKVLGRSRARRPKISKYESTRGLMKVCTKTLRPGLNLLVLKVSYFGRVQVYLLMSSGQK